METKMTVDEFKKLMTATGVPVRAYYNPKEVCSILGIYDRTFWRLTAGYEPDGKTGQPVEPCTIKSILLRRERRVSLIELVDFMTRNDENERACA
jgi:hypothetical protein